jgi:hypothetical protein
MAMTISGSTGVTYPDGSSQASGQQACKAWVNFNGTGTVAIRASLNVSSITDQGTGTYLVNFTTAFSDTNYATVFGGANTGNGDGAWNSVNLYLTPGTGQQTSNVAISSFTYNGSYQDQFYYTIACFR